MPKPNTRDAMKRYRAGKAGFTDKAHLKAKGLIPRADGTKKKSPQYEDAPANATGTAVAGTGDDSSTVVVRRKKDKEKMKDRLLRRFKIKETIDRLVPAIEPPTDEVRERVNQLKELALGEAFTSQQIKQAYGILNDPRYKQGNYSGAVAAIEKLAKGLSKHPDVANALKRANESVEHDSAFAISGVETERPTEEIQETIDAGEVSKMKDKKKEVDFKTANVSTTETIDAGEVSKMADKKKEVKFSTANVSTTEDKKDPKKEVIGSEKPEPTANLENTIRNIWNKAANETTERGDSVLLPTRNESKIPPIKPDNKPGVKIAKIRATRDKEDGPGDGAKDPTAMEKQILTLQGQVNVLKAKLENEKGKVVKPVADKETGQVPLTVGLAHKLLKDKAEKEEDKEVKKEAVSPYKLKYETLRARLKEKAEKEKLAKKKDEPTKGRTMTGNPATKVNTDPEINYNQ